MNVKCKNTDLRLIKVNIDQDQIKLFWKTKIKAWKKGSSYGHYILLKRFSIIDDSLLKWFEKLEN